MKPAASTRRPATASARAAPSGMTEGVLDARGRTIVQSRATVATARAARKKGRLGPLIEPGTSDQRPVERALTQKRPIDTTRAVPTARKRTVSESRGGTNEYRTGRSGTGSSAPFAA